MKIKNVLLSVLVLLQASLFAQNNTPIGREKLTLDKGWRFYKGDIEFPVITGHSVTYQSAKAGKAWGAAAPEYDDAAWSILNLPHDWAVESAYNPKANISQVYRERGIGWYRRSFKLSPNENGKHIELQFDGIATNATVWVNGTLLPRNFCGYTSM
jgi:beta-galactosidase